LRIANVRPEIFYHAAIQPCPYNVADFVEELCRENRECSQESFL
jgi:hypothetical protein